MPQLDPAYFSTQLVWLAITFALLYFVLARGVLPRIGDVLERRREQIADDVGRAEKVKAEAEAILAAYRQAIADARAEAQNLGKVAAAENAAEAARREAEFGAKLGLRTAEAEKRIALAKDTAAAEIETVAAQAAIAIAHRLAGVEVPAERARAAVTATRAKA
jgi:F-type H+-transporting ATPase subunit b